MGGTEVFPADSTSGEEGRREEEGGGGSTMADLREFLVPSAPPYALLATTYCWTVRI